MVNGPNRARIGRKLRMSEDRAVPPQDLTYTYRPSLLGAPYEFRLGAQGLEWLVGRKAGRVLCRDVTRVRLSFRPANLQPLRHRNLGRGRAEARHHVELVEKHGGAGAA